MEVGKLLNNDNDNENINEMEIIWLIIVWAEVMKTILEKMN